MGPMRLKGKSKQILSLIYFGGSMASSAGGVEPMSPATVPLGYRSVARGRAGGRGAGPENLRRFSAAGVDRRAGRRARQGRRQTTATISRSRSFAKGKVQKDRFDRTGQSAGIKVRSPPNPLDQPHTSATSCLPLCRFPNQNRKFALSSSHGYYKKINVKIISRLRPPRGRSLYGHHKDDHSIKAGQVSRITYICQMDMWCARGIRTPNSLITKAAAWQGMGSVSS